MNKAVFPSLHICLDMDIFGKVSLVWGYIRGHGHQSEMVSDLSEALSDRSESFLTSPKHFRPV